MRSAISVLAFVAVASSALAEDREASARPSLKLPLLVYAGSAVVDYHSTHYFLQFEEEQEWNPAISWLDHRPKTMIVVGAGMEATAAWVMTRWLGPKHPTLTKTLIYAITGIHIAAAARNYHTGDHLRIRPDDAARWARYRQCGSPC